MCLLLVFLLARVSPVAQNLFTYLRISEVFDTCTSGNFHLNYDDTLYRIGIQHTHDRRTHDFAVVLLLQSETD
jgi:hypothetical protein